ncbi:TIGR03619 family F420-dependent LLM class oxidoreductase [Kribbella caucasensis]|uniref:TIGR03619 family F420-dependent LLM class oxidoreductase n=1 Tax=Kribbella caucasensis TaxID=2512215 RepID=UPI00192D66F5|nr:TIGR03619 family F420-dependent LLM class oxidoreductase [Kribbella sp. VKM Ac-2527]
MELQVVLPDESAEMPPERLVELAVAAEEIGYGTAWLPDHLLPPAPFGATYGGVYEPLVSLAYIAARTTRIRLGTSVLVLPLRNPYAVAKQAATLHRLSGERLTLGVGAGWDAAEFAAVGVEFADRGRLTDEGLTILRELFEGTHEGGVFEPKLKAPLPLMVGGTTPRALRRAALLADEWQGLNLDGPGFTQSVERLRSYSDRPVRVGTRIHWSGDDPALAAAVTLAHNLATAGAETLAISFGNHQNAEAKLERFHHTFT